MNNEKPSIYTKLLWLIEDGKIEPENLFDFIELYFPTFILKDDYVFLKENYLHSEYKRLLNQKVNPEYWINLLTVDDFFPETTSGEKLSIQLAQSLSKLWELKLKNDFPSLNFIVKCLRDDEFGDCGLTFYQVKHQKNTLKTK